MALAKGARMRGVTIVEDCPVEDIIVEQGAVKGVKTKYGTVHCEVVVNCAGQWARNVGKMVGACIPLTVCIYFAV